MIDRVVHVLDWYTLAFVIALALLCTMIYLHMKMDAWDWLRFWTGGRIRTAIFNALKPFARFLKRL